MSWPDRCFHSQLLTKDVIDARALRRSAVVSGTAAVELSTAGDRTAESIARIVAGRATDRLRRLGSRYATGEADDRARRHLKYIGERDTEALWTAAELADGDVSDRLDRLAESVKTTATQEIEALDPQNTETQHSEETTQTPIPTVDGVAAGRWAGLDYEGLLEIADDLHDDDPEAGWRSLRVVSDESWNFVDGDRTVREIADAVGFEFDLKIEPGPIRRILEGHAEAGNLRFE
jgi:hypothetical protein